MTEPAAIVLARRAARIAFGAVLLGGMAAIVLGANDARGLETAHHFGLMWLAAALAWMGTRLLVQWAAPAPRGDALLRASLVVPAIGFAFALPLTLHLLLMLLIGSNLHGFGEWVGISVRVVGLAHVVFALLFGVRAHALATTARPRMTIPALFGWTVLASGFPYGLFVFPEAITAITGLAVLPVLLAFNGIAERERDAFPVIPTCAIVTSWPAHR